MILVEKVVFRKCTWVSSNIVVMVMIRENSNCVLKKLTEMERKYDLEMRKAIEQFGVAKKKLGKAFVVAHFVSLGVPCSAVYHVLVRCEASEDFERRPGSG